MIEFVNVSKAFGGVPAVSQLNFQVKPGEFVFVTGPSGSGKTTIVKLIIRELMPDEGEIVINGQNLAEIKSDLASYRRQIGVVFQDFKLINNLNVYENIAVSLRVQGKSAGYIFQRVSKIADLVGIKDKLELFPSQLAGGELQRVCLARAVVSKPQILLADEPTGNLDPATSWQIMYLLRQINRLGTTVLMATHNLEIVNSFNHRVIKLDNGVMLDNNQTHE